MNKLDGQVLASYKKMLEKQEEETQAPTGGKQSIFSPSQERKQRTPNKTAYKTPLKNEIELQKYFDRYLNFRSASRKAFRSTSKDNARASQALSGEKREGLSMQNQQIPVLEPMPENKEIPEEIKKLTGIVNEKQQLIVGVTQKLGEFISGFRNVRKGIDEIKSGKVDENALSSLEK